jgi:hypothetical protein
MREIETTPDARDWVAAVAAVYDLYPMDVFPPNSDSPDAKAGTWARHVCDLIVKEAHRRLNERNESALYAHQFDGVDSDG